MRRILAVALLLLTAVPSAGMLCASLCASRAAAEACQHRVPGVMIDIDHECDASPAIPPVLTERPVNVTPDAWVRPTSAVDALPPRGMARAAGHRDSHEIRHTDLTTVLRI